MNDQIMRRYQEDGRPSVYTQKKSNHPTQPGNSSTVPIVIKWKRRPILYRIRQTCKRVYWGRVAILVLVVFGLILTVCLIAGNKSAADPTEGAKAPQTKTEAPAKVIKKGYALTEAERREVASVVTAEAGGEPFTGKMAVAQCILQACKDDGIRPTEAVVKYKYAKSRPEPTEEALKAVQAVFDQGKVATSEPIKYFYAPALCYSEWHESQVYVMTIKGHKFFKEATK